MEPSRITKVTVWESLRTGHESDRFAIVSGESASNLVRTMTYERQDNPFYKVVGVVGMKATADAVIESTSGQKISVAFSDNRYFFWEGPQGQLSADFAKLYVQLPWQPGLPPAATTRSAD